MNRLDELSAPSEYIRGFNDGLDKAKEAVESMEMIECSTFIDKEEAVKKLEEIKNE